MALLAAGMIPAADAAPPEPGGQAAAPVRGFTAARSIARAYDVILNADFAALPDALAMTCGPAPSEACDTLAAVALAWRIALDPDDRSLDARFSTRVELAIDATRRWTRREPNRAEAWFYHGAAYGARVQWRVLRGERLAAARDGKRIKEALERALALDPEMHDAEFGIGMYRYYAAVAPAALRVLRWLLMLPGGDRAGGLAQMIAARDQGRLVRGEADYQIHIAYLWYEERFEEALRLVDSLRARYPRNPLFHQARAQILDTYFHDQTASLRAWEDLRLRARARLVNEPGLAAARATLRSARLLDALDESDRAAALLEDLAARQPARPRGALAKAKRLLALVGQRLASRPYRLALDAWRALERGELDAAERGFRLSLALDPADVVTRYRYALLLIAQEADDRALGELDRVLAAKAEASPVIHAGALFERAEIMARRGDRPRAKALYLEASRVFGADRIVTARAAQLARR